MTSTCLPIPRSRASLFAALALLLWVEAGTPSRASSPAPQPVAAGVVRIANRQGSEFSIGSGSVVARHSGVGVVLTCAHLFSDGVGELYVYFGDDLARRALLIAKDDKNDLACLAVDRPVGPVVPISLALPVPGTTLVSCGFGQQGEFQASHGDYLGLVTLEHGDREGVLEKTGAARQGDSGGPIFDSRGQLVGVIFGSDGQVVDGTHCSIVREFLTANRLTPDVARRVQDSARQPVDDFLLAFAPRSGAAVEIRAEPPIVTTVRGLVRFGDRSISGANVALDGRASRLATTDGEGRFVFDLVAGGHYELKIDTIVNNKFRRSERSIWVTSQTEKEPIEVELR